MDEKTKNKLVSKYVNKALKRGVNMSEDELTILFTNFVDKANRVFDEPAKRYREKLFGKRFGK